MSKPVESPFSQVSTTLLKAIFDRLCNEPVYLPLQPSNPRYTLSLVCKGWFDTVRSTHSFWENIHFTKALANAPPHKSSPLLKQFVFCTSLSGQNPLNITIDMVFNSWDFSIVRSIIIPHIHRIKTLSCPIYGNRDIIKFLTIGEGRFIILESMEILFFNMQTRPASSFPLGVCLQFCTFRTAPRLRKATIHILNGLHPIDLRLPWDQLTTLDLGTTSMPPEVFVTIMYSAAQQLEDASFNIRFSKLINQRRVLWKRSIVMKELQTLRLRLLFPSQDTRLFFVLQLPSLQNLSIEMHDHFQDWDIALYAKLLEASSKSLRKLYLIDYPPPENTDTGFVVRRRHRETNQLILDKFFEAIWNIQNLHLPLGLEIPAATVEKMASCAVLPQLSTLEQVGTVNGWSILSMIRRRHTHLLNTSLLHSQPEFVVGSSTRPTNPPKPLGALTYVYMLIPRQGYSVQKKRALVEEAQALALLGIACFVQSTELLPLPLMKQETGHFISEFVSQA